MPVYGSFTKQPIPRVSIQTLPPPPLPPRHTPSWPLPAIRMGIFQFSIQPLKKYINMD